MNQNAALHANIRDAVLRAELKDAAAVDDIFAPFREAALGKPYVVAQLGQSLDGRIATLSGESRWINGAGALDHLHRLRANVDAVVVGVGTVSADDPLLTVRRVDGPDPVRVVIDPNARMKFDAKCLASGRARCLVVRPADEPSDAAALPNGAERLEVERRGDHIDPADIVAALFEQGLRKILVEGGATTISRFINAGAVDRLHVLVAPVILGSGISGLSLSPIAHLHHAMRPSTRVHILDDGDVLFDCDLRRQSKG